MPPEGAGSHPWRLLEASGGGCEELRRERLRFQRRVLCARVAALASRHLQAHPPGDGFIPLLALVDTDVVHVHAMREQVQVRALLTTPGAADDLVQRKYCYRGVNEAQTRTPIRASRAVGS